MAFDPFRKSLILFGGSTTWPSSASSGYSLPAELLDDTWEWNSGTRQWTELSPQSSPQPRDLHGMVTDSGRAKVLLFGGETYACSSSPMPGAPTDCSETYSPGDVWSGWREEHLDQPHPRHPGADADGFISPLLSFDEGRQKMFLLPAQPSSWTGPGSAFGSNGGTPSAVSGSGSRIGRLVVARHGRPHLSLPILPDLRQPAPPADLH